MVVRNPCRRAPAAQVLAGPTDEVLEDHRPLPAIVHLHVDAADEEDRRGHQQGDEHGVEHGEMDLRFLHGTSLNPFKVYLISFSHSFVPNQ